MAGTVLLMTDDPHVEQQLETACGQLDARLEIVSGQKGWSERFEAVQPDIALIDLGRSVTTGLSKFDKLCQQFPRLCAILIADRARSEQAIDAMKHGAIDYLLKPLHHTELVSHLENAFRISRDMTVPTVYKEQERSDGVERIVGESPAMHQVFKLIGLIAPRDVNVLITGESGTGKELVAKALYHHSRRRDFPFLAVNCAAIPETLLESELFGHEKGAFTGADVRRIGKFEQCRNGTLFLDEIGDLPLATQAKLLRVLQDGSFQRLGGTETIHADVRVLAVTNQPIERMIAERRFRQDLFFRLKVTHIDLPPLRERDVDSVLLAHYFVRRFNPQMNTTIQRFSPEVLGALLSYDWPGNVRELENVVKASLVVARGNVFQLDFLPERIRQSSNRLASPDEGKTPLGGVVGENLSQMCRTFVGRKQFHGQLYKQIIRVAEREIIRACLSEARGQIAPAARMLGITRTTLRKKMAELEIHVDTEIRT